MPKRSTDDRSTTSTRSARDPGAQTARVLDLLLPESARPRPQPLKGLRGLQFDGHRGQLKVGSRLADVVLADGQDLQVTLGLGPAAASAAVRGRSVRPSRSSRSAGREPSPLDAHHALPGNVRFARDVRGDRLQGEVPLADPGAAQATPSASKRDHVLLRELRNGMARAAGERACASVAEALDLGTVVQAVAGLGWDEQRIVAPDPAALERALKAGAGAGAGTATGAGTGAGAGAGAGDAAGDAAGAGAGAGADALPAAEPMRWELRARRGEHVVAVHVVPEADGLCISRELFRGAVAPGCWPALEDAALRMNARLRSVRLSTRESTRRGGGAAGAGLGTGTETGTDASTNPGPRVVVAETRLHARLVEPARLAHAVRAVAAASDFATTPLRLLAEQPALRALYDELLLGSPAPGVQPDLTNQNDDEHLPASDTADA